MEIRKLLSPAASELEQLTNCFQDYLASEYPQLAHESEDKKFLFSAYQQTVMIGGISGNVYWDGLEIDTLWVGQEYRGQGIGQQLLAAAEEYARENKAVVAFLKTVDAREFYQRSGYHVYGVLEDRPRGSLLYHMKKRLDAKIT